jgi:DNA-binding NtrC family response regulator
MPPLRVKNKNVAELIDKFIGDGVGMDQIMLRFRNSVVVRALTLTEGNVSRAAVLLKTHRNNVYDWLREYKMHEEAIIAEAIQDREGRNSQLQEKSD